MSFRDPIAKTFSRIAKNLKVSKYGKPPLVHIVQIVREHFQAETCSLYEVRNGVLSMVAADEKYPSSGTKKSDNPEKLPAPTLERKEAVFTNKSGVIPLVYHEKVVGLLTIQKEATETFTLQEKDFLGFIAIQLAGVIRTLAITEQAKGQLKEDQGTSLIGGTAVSSGFGIGPAFFLHSGITTMGFSKLDSSLQNKEEEGSKLREALQKTSHDLGYLEKVVENKFSKDESDIFNSHQAILADPDLLKKLQFEIQGGKSALEAVGDVLRTYMLQFGDIKIPGFNENVVDLEELMQRIFENLLGMDSRMEKEDWAGILVANSLGPSDTIRLDPSKLLGIVTMTGGPNSHAAILARSLDIPAVMGAAGIMDKINPGDLLIVDGDKGEVIVNPGTSLLHDYELLEEKRVAEMVALDGIANEPAITLDGHLISLEANASFPADIKKLGCFGAEGVGLFRTEFLFLKVKSLSNENEQFEIYREMIKDAKGLPITFRLLDAGGDKLIESLCVGKEVNPFLGYRSIRLTLSKPEILKTQFRALLRASAFGKIRLLIPMISGMEEVDAMKEILEGVKTDLSLQNTPYDPKIPMGFMVEVPSAVALVPFFIQKADFLSIGTNDLIQYTLAVDRNNERVASFFEPLHPAVLSFISQVAEVGRRANKPVSICGEMASDTFIIPLLVGLGINCLSMVSSGIPGAKKVIRSLNYQQAQEMAKQVLQASRIREVKAILSGYQKASLH